VAGGGFQVVQHLPSKHEAQVQVQTPVLAKENKEERWGVGGEVILG
jgi:hypothetical protein